ncbi:hypothetical protein BOTBODRAFT_348167 [Botryobasidium botryosum FD-172 SS1]|uniref:Uncharacterized protein n=1 Tax=Botryobasidium botryosum (strain FD-172 SS1) TaxID=930990 RepID=A0A067MFG7_BOTB1|nr:hypothetical protein BOTBODRAFT_348167 [Botryobasidium botryosum FD-172 SS1]
MGSSSDARRSMRTDQHFGRDSLSAVCLLLTRVVRALAGWLSLWLFLSLLLLPLLFSTTFAFAFVKARNSDSEINEARYMHSIAAPSRLPDSRIFGFTMFIHVLAYVSDEMNSKSKSRAAVSSVGSWAVPGPKKRTRPQLRIGMAILV